MAAADMALGCASLARLVFLLAVISGATAARKCKPTATVSAAPLTANLRNMRSAAGAVAAAWSAQPVNTSYPSFLAAMRKPRSTASSAMRRRTFAKTLANIIAVNNNKKLKWVAAPNAFTDLTPDELARQWLGTFLPSTTKARVAAALRATRQTPAQIAAEAAPEVTSEALGMAAAAAAYLDPADPAAASVLAKAGVSAQGMLQSVPDWSTVLPGVKNQGNCRSCWAFATTALVEAGHYIKTGKVLSLSEKQLVDCDMSNDGCDGGWYDDAFQYIIQAGGQCTAGDYPYTAVGGECPASMPPFASKIASYKQLPANNEAAMLAALQDGPIGVAITVNDAIKSYAGGVFSSSTCGGPVNHAVVVVGAGVDTESGTPFWLVRDTKGPWWGEGGYIRIQRGVGGAGMCNIASHPYSIISDAQPPPPPPVPSCGNRTIAVTKDTNLNQLARAYGMSVAQIMIDNGLRTAFDNGSNPETGRFVPDQDVDPALKKGSKLTLRCPTGNWSVPLGSWEEGQRYQGMVAAPLAHYCPPGEYVVEIYVRPSTQGWDEVKSGWVGGVTMTCSDGTKMTVDATYAKFNPNMDGTQTQMNGFTSVFYTSAYAIDSLLGVGEVQVQPSTFACPPDTLLTGFSAGQQVWCYPGYCEDGALETLQFFCSNPYGSGAAAVESVRKLRSTQFPRIKAKLSCKAVLAAAGDTWVTLAARYSSAAYPIAYYDVIRANPKLGGGGGGIPAGARVFIPPCINGVLQGALANKPAGAKSQEQSLEDASPQDLAEAGASAFDSSTAAGQAAIKAAFEERVLAPLLNKWRAQIAAVAASGASDAAAAAASPQVAVAPAEPASQQEPAAAVDGTPAPAEALVEPTADAVSSNGVNVSP